MSTGGWRKLTDTMKDIERQMRAQRPDADESNLRRHGRVRPGTLQCHVGEVLDFSASGLRIKSRKPLEGELKLILGTQDRRIGVVGRVVWSKKVGFRNYEAGIEFVNIPPEDLAVLRTMAVFT